MMMVNLLDDLRCIEEEYMTRRNGYVAMKRQKATNKTLFLILFILN